MLGRDDAHLVEGAQVLGPDGEVLGQVARVYGDRDSGHLEWAGVELADGTRRFVPLAEARLEQGGLVVPYRVEQVAGAPPYDPEAGNLGGEDENELYHHYGVVFEERPQLVGLPEATGTPATGAYAEPSPEDPLLRP